MGGGISQIEGAGVRVGGWGVERQREKSLCNPYYLMLRARELFKKLFVVPPFFPERAVRGRDEGGRTYYVISIKRLKTEDGRIMIFGF